MFMKPESSNPQMGLFKSAFKAIVITSSLGVLAVLFIYLGFVWGKQSSHITLARFDLKTTKEAFIQAAAEKQLSRPEMAVLSKQFVASLVLALHGYIVEHHAWVFLTDGRLLEGDGEVNATPLLQARIAANMADFGKAEKAFNAEARTMEPKASLPKRGNA